jgi:hypothetical protein
MIAPCSTISPLDESVGLKAGEDSRAQIDSLSQRNSYCGVAEGSVCSSGRIRRVTACTRARCCYVGGSASRRRVKGLTGKRNDPSASQWIEAWPGPRLANRRWARLDLGEHCTARGCSSEGKLLPAFGLAPNCSSVNIKSDIPNATILPSSSAFFVPARSWQS